MKHLYENEKLPQKNEDIIKEYERFVNYYNEPIKNYKANLSLLKNTFEELKINYKNFFFFFQNNFRFTEKIETGFFSNKKFVDILYKEKDKIELLRLTKDYSESLESIEENYLVWEESLWWFKGKHISDSDDNYIDLNLSKEVEEAFQLITPFGKIKETLAFKSIDGYEAKKPIDGHHSVYRDYCTPKTNSFFDEYLICLFRVARISPPILSEKGVKNFYQRRVEYYENKKRKHELLIRQTKKRDYKEENIGTIYIMSNKSLPKDTYKIGSTYGLAEERAEELTGTGHLNPFIVVGEINIQSAEYYEKLIHKLLDDYRVKKGREFFKLDLGKIKECLEQVSEISRKGEDKITLSELKKEIRL